MEFKFVDKRKNSVEVEFDEKEIPLALTGMLLKNDVDAYWYEPHPLQQAVRLHIDSEDPMGDLKKAVSMLDSEWGQFKKAVEAKLNKA